MKRIGMHMSFESVEQVMETLAYNELNTLQICTRNTRSMRARSSIEYELSMLSERLMSKDIQPLVIHAPYTLNPASPDDSMRDKCVRLIQTDMNMLNLEVPVRYVLHPGSYMFGTSEDGMLRLIEVLKRIDIPRNVMICVETMSGAGTQLMYCESNLELFARNRIQNVYLTFDTCHVFAAGMYCTTVYDKYKDLIKVVHLNGSEYQFRSFRDRHAPINDNALLKEIVNRVDAATPIILETPSVTMQNDVAWLKKVVHNSQ